MTGDLRSEGNGALEMLAMHHLSCYYEVKVWVGGSLCSFPSGPSGYPSARRCLVEGNRTSQNKSVLLLISGRLRLPFSDVHLCSRRMRLRHQLTVLS